MKGSDMVSLQWQLTLVSFVNVCSFFFAFQIDNIRCFLILSNLFLESIALLFEEITILLRFYQINFSSWIFG